MSAPVEIVRYPTLAACLRAFHGLSGRDRLPDGVWEWKTSDGTLERLRDRYARREIRKRKCWGWCENKGRIHLWIAPGAEYREVFKLLAHEFGHMQRPYYRSLDEEQKACKYAKVAEFAWDVANGLLAGGEKSTKGRA